eukprot:gene8125-16679_t
MGNGVGTLNEENRIEIVRAVRSEYEAKSGQGIPDQELQEILLTKYDTAFSAAVAKAEQQSPKKTSEVALPPTSLIGSASADSIVSTTPPQKSKTDKPTPARRPSEDKAKVGFGSSAARSKDEEIKPKVSVGFGVGAARNVGHSGAVRRKSFDPRGAPAAVHVKKASFAAVALEELKEMEVDTWDSAISQPTCPICNIVFPTEARKDQHMKFSELHALKVKAIERQEKQVLEAAQKVEDSATPSLIPEKDDENTQMIYVGSKFFWRARSSVDVHIYKHLRQNALEVIIFDVEKHKEMSRIYLDVEKMITAIGTETINNKILEMEAERASADVPADAIVFTTEMKREESIRACISSFVLARLQYREIGPSGQPASIAFTPSQLDNPELDPTVTAEALKMEPVMIFRRRRTSVQDVSSILIDVVHAQKTATSAVQEAHKFTQQVDKHLDK